MNKLLLTLLAVICTLCAYAQDQRVIKGTVVDEANEPLIGVTVRIDGTSIAVSTNVDGEFALPVPKDKKCKISVSYVGYTPMHIDVAPGKDSYEIKLEPNSNLMDEVVVIGYGTAKKTSLTSSVETISGDELIRIPAMNVDQTLAGQVAGLGVMSTTGDPSSAKEAEMHIRGNNGAPLLVIDGVPRLGTNTSDGEMRLSDLNPDDIESISVLKDAAAAAVYGSRAANGVILVQTKRGSNEGRAKVSYRGQFNLQEATYLPKFLNAYQFAELYNRAVEANGADSGYTPYDLNALNSNPNLYADENMLDYLDKWGHSQRHSVSVSGGVKSIRYFLSGGYTSTKGLYSNVGRDRYNYSAKIDADLIKDLTLQVDITGSISENKNTSYTTIDAAYNYSPLQVLRFTDGNLASISGSNPLIAVDGLGGYNKVKSNFLTLNAVLRYNISPIPGLSAYVKGTIDLNHQNVTQYSKPVTLYLYDEATGTTSADPNTMYPKAKISLTDRYQDIDNKLIEAGISYDHTFAEKHSVTALLVANYQDYKNKYLSGTNNNLPGAYPEVMGTTSTGTITGNEYYSERASIVGRATYGYSNRYFGEFSFRYDGSTRFAPENRWGFFPTISASWVISNEKFFSHISPSAISFAKLRGSMGILGDDGSVSDYSYLLKYIFSPNGGYPIGGNFAPGIIPATGEYPNRDLKWGKSKDWNAGLDLGFWDNRITASVEWYQRTRTNMVMSAPEYLFPPSTGTDGAVPSINIGKVRYRGWDFTLKHVNTIGNFKYNVTFNLSKTSDVVLDYGDESSQPENLRRKGKSYMTWSVYDAAGIFQSYEEIQAWPVDQDGLGNATLAPGDIKYRDHDGNGVLTTNDKIYVKNASYPDLTYGINLGVQYKGIYLSAQLQGVSGYSQKINEIYSLENNSLPRFQQYHLTDTWTPENTSASYPRIKFTSRADNNRLDSTFWIRKCNFLRLKALTIGYRFPTSMLRKAHITQLDIALQGGNLYTWSSLDNMDPESLRGYPLQRSYGLSLNFGF